MPYLIKERTLALIPDNNSTKVLEEKKIIILNETPREVVSRNCQSHGSTLEGRQKGSAYLIGSTYKPPIILNDLTNIILIPTHSIRNNKCAWISLNNILNYCKKSNNEVLIEFKNHKKVIINISYAIFDKQVLRATRLESALRGRNNKKYL